MDIKGKYIALDMELYDEMVKQQNLIYVMQDIVEVSAKQLATIQGISVTTLTRRGHEWRMPNYGRNRPSPASWKLSEVLKWLAIPEKDRKTQAKALHLKGEL